MAALTVSINGDNSHLAKALQGAQSHVNRFAANISIGLKDVFKANVYQGMVNMAAKLIADPVGKIKEAFAAGGQLQDLKLRTGANIEDLIALREAFLQAGISGNSLGPTINKLQGALGGMNEQGEDTTSIFGQLGLDVARLKKESPTAQILAIGNAINRLGDASQRAAAARKIFGKGGGEMLQLFNDKDGMKAAAEGAGTFGTLMAKNAALFDRIDDLIESGGRKLKQLWVGIASGLAPVLLPIVEKLNRVDFAKWGQQIGAAIAVFAQAFKDGTIGELLGLSLKIGAMKGANVLDHLFRGVINALPEILSHSVTMLAEDLKLLMSPQFWMGLVNVLAGAATKFGAYMLDALRRPLVLLQSGIEWVFQQMFAKLSKVPGMSKLLGGDFSQPETLAQISKRNMEDGPTLFGQSSKDLHKLADEELARGGADLLPLMKARLKLMQEQSAKIAGRFMEGFGGSPDAFDTSAEQRKLAGMINTLQARATQATAAAQSSASGNGDDEMETALGRGKATGNKGIMASSLAKIGGGGNFAGGTVGLQREANSLLKRIVANTTGLKTGAIQPAKLQPSVARFG